MTRTEARWMWGTLAVDGSLNAGLALVQGLGRTDVLGSVCLLLLVLAVGLFCGSPLVVILPRQSRSKLIMAAARREPTLKPWQTEMGSISRRSRWVDFGNVGDCRSVPC